jgi:disulfide bond formation protein DsbB
MSVDSLNQLLGTATLAIQIVTAAIIVALLFRSRVQMFADVIRQVGSCALLKAFVLTLISVAITLYYSDVLGFEPCALCWWQRIFMYPQVILFGIALWKKDDSVWLPSIILSALGLAVALYHHTLQMLPAGSLPCPSQGVSCAKITFVEFGYITYPLMAATLFALLIVLMISRRVTH